MLCLAKLDKWTHAWQFFGARISGTDILHLFLSAERNFTVVFIMLTKENNSAECHSRCMQWFHLTNGLSYLYCTCNNLFSTSYTNNWSIVFFQLVQLVFWSVLIWQLASETMADGYWQPSISSWQEFQLLSHEVHIYFSHTAVSLLRYRRVCASLLSCSPVIWKSRSEIAQTLGTLSLQEIWMQKAILSRWD